MKKIICALMLTAMLVVLAGCFGCGDSDVETNGGDYIENGAIENNNVENGGELAAAIADGALDGTWAYNAETIIFDGENFEVSGSARTFLPDGTGTFAWLEDFADFIVFSYDDGNIVPVGFSFDENRIEIAGHPYVRVVTE